MLWFVQDVEVGGGSFLVIKNCGTFEIGCRSDGGDNLAISLHLLFPRSVQIQVLYLLLFDLSVPLAPRKLTYPPDKACLSRWFSLVLFGWGHVSFSLWTPSAHEKWRKIGPQYMGHVTPKFVKVWGTPWWVLFLPDSVPSNIHQLSRWCCTNGPEVDMPLVNGPLPETNSKFAPENRPSKKKTRKYSNHPFLGANC